MELQAILRTLCSARESDGPIVTLTLEVAQARFPPSAKAFLRNAVQGRYDSTEDSTASRETLKSISERVGQYAESELHSEAQGLFLVVGDHTWQPVQLPVPMRNFIHVGRLPYVAPLLEAAMQTPRAYVLKYDHLEGVVEDFEGDTWREVDRIPSAAVKRDAEHKSSRRAALGRTGTRRTGGGMGGGGRDRFERHFEDATEAMLVQCAARVVSLQKRAPSEAIYAFGDREHFPFFRDHLAPGLRSQAIHVGPLPHRHEDLLR